MFSLSALAAALGGLSGLAALLPVVKQLRRFKWPLLILSAAIGVSALTLVAVAKHQAAVAAVKAEAREQGRVEEEAKWRLAAAKVELARSIERERDQAKIRDIGIALGDARMELRERRDDFDREMLAIENAGGGDNLFDPRVVRALNARRGARAARGDDR